MSEIGFDSQDQECNGQSILAVLEQGRSFLDRVESGENLAVRAARSRTRRNLADEERNGA